MDFCSFSQNQGNYPWYSKIKILNSRNEERLIIEQYIEKKARPGEALNILEAGCGKKWELKLSNIKYTLTGVDINKTVLEIRNKKHKDLDEIIEGDLRYIELKKKYNIIYNSFVLEHIKDAERVLKNFVKWLRPGGLLILRLPDRDSVYGFVTSVTPFWFHILYWKLLNISNVGKPGYGPYPTAYDKIVSRKGIQQFSSQYGLVIREEYGNTFKAPSRSLLSKALSLFMDIVQTAGYIISCGRLSKHYYLTYILEKKV